MLSKTLGHNDCTIIQQIQFENDLIEVLDGVVLKISSRRLISCPIAEESRRKISPRIFVPYDSTIIPHATPKSQKICSRRSEGFQKDLLVSHLSSYHSCTEDCHYHQGKSVFRCHDGRVYSNCP